MPPVHVTFQQVPSRSVHVKDKSQCDTVGLQTTCLASRGSTLKREKVCLQHLNFVQYMIALLLKVALHRTSSIGFLEVILVPLRVNFVRFMIAKC
jgi:hypothetical protein